jgi:hypothetical protein
MIMGEPRLIDARIFADGLMGLQGDLLTVPLEARFAYDTERNTFFLNMEGMSLATLDEVESIGTEIEKRWAHREKGADGRQLRQLPPRTGSRRRLHPSSPAGRSLLRQVHHQIAAAMS